MSFVKRRHAKLTSSLLGPGKQVAGSTHPWLLSRSLWQRKEWLNQEKGRVQGQVLSEQQGDWPTCLPALKTKISKLGQIAGQFPPTQAGFQTDKPDIVTKKRKKSRLCGWGGGQNIIDGIIITRKASKKHSPRICGPTERGIFCKTKASWSHLISDSRHLQKNFIQICLQMCFSENLKRFPNLIKRPKCLKHNQDHPLISLMVRKRQSNWIYCHLTEEIMN